VNRSGRALEVALDLAEGIGAFVEVETIAGNEAEIPEAQAAVLELARTVGLTDLERRSYLRMALEQRAAATNG
jgi:adenylate cyclase class 2